MIGNICIRAGRVTETSFVFRSTALPKQSSAAEAAVRELGVSGKCQAVSRDDTTTLAVIRGETDSGLLQ